MRLIGRDKLCPLKGLDIQIDKWIAGWTVEITHADWHDEGHVVDQFPTVYNNNKGLFKFQVGLAKYGIEVLIAFPQKTVLITGLTNF